MLALHSALIARGWGGSAAVTLAAYLAAALNLADADVSPVANLGGRAALSIQSPYGTRRLMVSSAIAALLPILGPILPLLGALAAVSGLFLPAVFVTGALIGSISLLAYGSARILDATEEIPAPVDLFAEMVPMSGARAANLGVAQLALAGLVWVSLL